MSERPVLTKSQQRVLDYIRSFQAEAGYPPTHAEIARGLGFRSPNAASDHVRALARREAIELAPGLARGIRILGDDMDDPGAKAAKARTGLPIIGEVAAGSPILAEENVEETVDIEAKLFRPRADYLLRVRGDSMIEAGICPGDLVAVHATRQVREGQIAVVRLDQDVTLKRWHRVGREVELQPANRKYKPIRVDPRRTDLAIEGVTVGLLRLGSPPR